MSDKPEKREYTFTEAPAAINFFGVTQRGWNIQLSLRDDDEFFLLERFGKLVKRLEEIGVHPKAVGQQPAAVTKGEPAPEQIPDLGIVPPPAPPANGDGTQVLKAVKIEVTPKPDGKAELKFYAEGHKYPDIYATNTVERLLEMLAATGGWSAHHLQTARTFDLAVDVTWKPSQKLNSKGQPYKDIVSVRLS